MGKLSSLKLALIVTIIIYLLTWLFKSIAPDTFWQLVCIYTSLDAHTTALITILFFPQRILCIIYISSFFQICSGNEYSHVETSHTFVLFMNNVFLISKTIKKLRLLCILMLIFNEKKKHTKIPKPCVCDACQHGAQMKIIIIRTAHYSWNLLIRTLRVWVVE